MKIQEIIQESRPGRQRVGLWFHGTSTANVQDIKQQGLQPRSRNAQQGMGSDGPAGHLYSSYGGIYLSRSIDTAFVAAQGAAKKSQSRPVCVAVQLVVGSSGLDEDTILSPVLDPWNEYLPGLVPKSVFVKTLSHWFQERKIVIPAQSQLALLTDLWQAIREFLRKIPESQREDINDIEEDTELLADNKFRQAMAAVMEKVKHQAVISRDYTTRLIRPIGFRGKSRILGIHEFPNENYMEDKEFLAWLETMEKSMTGQRITQSDGTTLAKPD